MIRNYFYRLLTKYLRLYVTNKDRLVEINPSHSRVSDNFSNCKIYQMGNNEASGFSENDFKQYDPTHVLLNSMPHYERDIQASLGEIRKLLKPECRVIMCYYSQLWKPLAQLASLLRLRSRTPEVNWLTHGDVENLLELADFELVRRDHKVLLPFYIPILSNLVNRYLAPLPFFQWMCMLTVVVARPKFEKTPDASPMSVSVVVAARNEAGHIDELIERLPKMGPSDELIFIEGGSKDNTWEKILEAKEKNPNMQILVGQQDGKGKGDAVRKGFDMATKDILMILDADLTVPPEDLPRFYQAIVKDKGEYINGSRLVYPMEKRAMRFFNLLGNKFFAMAFTFVLGQTYKDTLCGTKVLTRKNYLRLAENRHFFGEFDPFGDFDLIFGTARMGLKTIEVPITYRERRYGDTNISRWTHGVILLRMLIFAARKIKFI